jgi:flagellar basal body rod protein FlgG
MGNGIYIATSGAVAQSTAMDVLSNNLANAGTAGFRAERVAFGTVLGQATTPDSTFVQVATTRTDSQNGTIRQTGQALDLALHGDGFFAVDTPRGVRYTRAGAFSVDAEGKIVNPDGLAARAKGGGNLTIPKTAQAVSVDGDGNVFADDQQIGTLELARFAPGNVIKEGGSLYAAVPGAQATIGELPQVIGGAVEQENFSVVRGMVDLVKISRTYDTLHRMIESYKTIDDMTARQLGGPR